jgi:hypothetical protein
MPEPASSSILIVTGAGEPVESRPGRPLQPRGTVGDAVVRVTETAVTDRKANMRAFLDHLQEILTVDAAMEGLFRMDSVEVSAEVTAEGKVGLLGIGATVEGSATVKLVFKRLAPAAAGPRT